MKPLLTGWNFALEMWSLLDSPVIFCACIMLQDRLGNKTLLIFTAGKRLLGTFICNCKTGYKKAKRFILG